MKQLDVNNQSITSENPCLQNSQAQEATATLNDLLVQDAEQIKGGFISSIPSGTGKTLTSTLLGKAQ